MVDNQIFVGRLPKHTRNRDLEDIFYPYGKLTRCEVKQGNSFMNEVVIRHFLFSSFKSLGMRLGKKTIQYYKELLIITFFQHMGLLSLKTVEMQRLVFGNRGTVRGSVLFFCAFCIQSSAVMEEASENSQKQNLRGHGLLAKCKGFIFRQGGGTQIDLVL